MNNHTIDLRICVDCIVYLANGDLPEEWYAHTGGTDLGPKGFLAAVAYFTEGLEVTPGSLECEYCPTDDNEDCEPWFSWSSCDMCHSRLGGNRAHATLWVESR